MEKFRKDNRDLIEEVFKKTDTIARSVEVFSSEHRTTTH